MRLWSTARAGERRCRFNGMKEVNVPAFAKINLTLDVTGRRPDGYHTVKMVMQTLELHDDLRVRRGTGTGVRMKSNLRFLPDDETNLAVRAARLFFERTGLPDDGVEIELYKRIPVAAGLAGGSSDAAAVLRAMNELYETGLPLEKLREMGLALGADVPYCVAGGSQLAEGIGEVLTPLPPMPACHVVVCKPPFSVITAKVYARMNGGKLAIRPDTKGMLEALEQGDYKGVCRRLYNVMEAVTGGDYAEIGEIKDALLDGGADGALMSGSGPTVFGLFSDEGRARAAAEELKKRFPDTVATRIRTEPSAKF